MRNIRVLAISIALMIVLSCVVMYSSFAGKEEIGEVNEKDVIRLIPPPFIEIAQAQEPMNGSNAFPQDMAGIAAWVNAEQQIDLQLAAQAFDSLLEVGDDTYTSEFNYIIGKVGIAPTPYATKIYPKVYVDTNGYIIAYFDNTEPASDIISWHEYGDPALYDNPSIYFTTDTAIAAVCDKIGISFETIQNSIQFYDFEYPTAQKMLIVLNAVPSQLIERVHIAIPATYTLYEASYSLFAYSASGSGSNYLYIDVLQPDQLPESQYYIAHATTLLTGLSNIVNKLTVGEPHTIIMRCVSGVGGLGNVFIYTEG
jgi:hypothetical protein